MNAIPPKIRTMVPMLGSEQDGDVLAAARGIGRTLAGVGLSYHELAQAIPTQAPHARKPSDLDHADWPRWRETWARSHRSRTYTPRQEATHRAQAKFCRDEDRGRLNPRERRFVHDIAKLHGALSIAQSDWLAAITDRLEQKGSHAWQ